MIELWMPSPCYSTSRGPYNKVVLHSTQGAMTIESLGSFFSNGANQVSSHFGADNYQRGVVGAYVYEQYKAWTQGNANPYCLSLELCAYTEWDRQYWLDTQQTLLENTAQWIAWMCSKYSIPLRILNDAQAQNPDEKGVCQHVNFGSWGGGHVDLKGGFPMDVVMEMAASGSVNEVIDMTPAIAQYNGIHLACIWKDNTVRYKAPGWSSWEIVDPNSRAIGGLTMDINQSDGHIAIAYINPDHNVCTYEKNIGNAPWVWADRGGDAI